jgi:replicative DNA helicase
MDNKNYKILPILTQNEAIAQANEKIKKAMTEDYPGLLTRWSKVNASMGGCFRFNEITAIHGASGSGKSYILNMIREDFCDKQLNHFSKPFKILSFSFEMSAADELIRTYSSKMKTSYSKLVSTETKITEEYFNDIIETSKMIENDIIYYVETSGNREEIKKTVEKFNSMFPGHQLIITFDHSLLAEYLDEQNEVDLINRVSRLALFFKKQYGAMVIILGQLNAEIEKTDRIINADLHYPKKSDIHGGKSIYMACDTVIVIHRPEKLQIILYGRERFPTKDLVAWHFLKGRMTGTEGMFRMKQAFSEGTLIYPYS